MRRIILIVLLSVALSGALLMCQQSASPLPELAFVTEMAPFGNEYSQKPPASLPSTVAEEFNKKWKKIADAVEKKVTTEILVGILRWAKEQMKEYTPPVGWIHKIPMQAIRTSEDAKIVLFFQEPEQGFPIPSHSPIVFRRLMVSAAYDLKTQTILKVYVTIRGWKEE